MNIAGNIRDVINLYVNLKQKQDANFKIVAFKRGEAISLVRNKDKEMLMLLGFSILEAESKFENLRADSFLKNITSPLKPLNDYLAKKIFDFGMIEFSILTEEDVDEKKLNNSKIFKEIKTMDDFQFLMDNNLYCQQYLYELHKYVPKKMYLEEVDEKGQRMLFREFRKYVTEEVYKYIQESGIRIPEVMSFEAFDLKRIGEIYGPQSMVNMILKNPANKYSVPENVVEVMEKVFIDMEMTEENQKNLVKALQRTKIVAAKDIGGKITKLAAKLDDKFFDVLLKDFPTLKAQVEDVPYVEQIINNFDNHPTFLCLKWSKDDLIDKSSLDRTTRDLFHSKRTEIVKLCGLLGDVKLENSNNMGNGLEYFILNTSTNPGFDLNDFKNNFKMIMNEYFNNHNFREVFIEVNKVASFELALDILESKKSNSEMKKELQDNNIQNNQKMLKLKKF